MENKDYWFGLRSYMYVDIKDGNMLLYNTINGEYLETAYVKNIELISQLSDFNNLGFTLLSRENQKDIRIHEFVMNILNNGMGDILDVNSTKNKPVRLIPILNLQKDVDKLIKTENNCVLIGQDIYHYLIELNIYLNSLCTKECPICDEYCKQILCCTRGADFQELPIGVLKNVFDQVSFFVPKRINLLGGDVFKYTDIDKLSDLFQNYNGRIYLYFNYKNYQIHNLLTYINIEIIINFPVDNILLEKVFSSVCMSNTTFHFVIEDEDQYNQSKMIIKNFLIEKYILNPIFNNNIEFFSENVFLKKEDIFSNVISMREIFRNQKMNANNFGTLYILPDGEVKANMNTLPLGDIKTDSLLNLIHKEMIENTAWRSIRNISPCNKCLYQWLCPPLSNYEFVIDQPNLCDIKF